MNHLPTWNMALLNLSNWQETNAILDILKEKCLCKICNSLPEEPLEYICGHFVCKNCYKKKGNTCPLCRVPCHSSEIIPELLVSINVDAWKVLSHLFDSKRKNDIKKKDSVRSVQQCSLNSKTDVVKPNSKEFTKVSETVGSKKSEETKSRVSNKKSRVSIDKRNNKGETQLQIACIKGNVEKVKKLLEEGANPNTKDNAGWTPLHEAVQHGFIEIIECLLQAGAEVDATGSDNVTPLHEAVMCSNLKVVKLLLMYGANINARNANGRTPRDLATSEDISAALTEKVSLRTPTRTKAQKEGVNWADVTLFAANVKSASSDKVEKFASQFKLKFSKFYCADVTHVIVSDNQNGACSPSYVILSAILQGKWIISFHWIDYCHQMKKLMDFHQYEVSSVGQFNSDAPKRGRINKNKQLPGLFDGVHFFLASSNFSVGNLELDKGQITTLINFGGGNYLSREPNPEAIPPDESTVPYHADANGLFAKCSHVILYQPGKNEPLLKYNMPHVKTLPIEWFLKCIQTFSFGP